MNQIKCNMELFDLSVRRLANGNKMRVILETSEDLELEKQLIEFRGDNVKIAITQSTEPENLSERVVIDSSFEVFDIKCRRLRNGDKLSLILEKMYDKEEEIDLVKLRYNEVSILMNRINQDLPGLRSEENGSIYEDNEIDLEEEAV